ncbi:hypothetical protein D3C84_695070 [compost metagenome]
MACQEILGERLGAFKLGRAGGRAEAIQATAAEQVDDTGNQWHLWANDGQGDVLFGEVRKLFQGQDVDGDVLALGFNGGAGVARGNKNLRHAWVLCDFPGQGVFTSTAADDQNIHVKHLDEANSEDALADAAFL